MSDDANGSQGGGDSPTSTSSNSRSNTPRSGREGQAAPTFHPIIPAPGAELELSEISSRSSQNGRRAPPTPQGTEGNVSGRAVETEQDEEQGGAVDGSTTVISMANVHKTYLLGIDGVPALRGVSLTVKSGEFIVVYGTSGGGKTSLLNIMGTIDAPTKGGLTLFDTRIDRKTREKDLANIRMNEMGFVFQTFNLIASMTALENVELPMILKGELSPAQRRDRARMMLEKVGLPDRMNHMPSMLSGGEQQRVTIARALVNKPNLLLLDEPTGDLDTVNTDKIMNILLQLNAEGITMVMVTHDDALKHCAHRIVYMMDGRIKRIVNVTPEERQAQIQRLRTATRELRTGLRDGVQGEPVSRCSRTTLRTPANYTMRPQVRAVPAQQLSNEL